MVISHLGICSGFEQYTNSFTVSVHYSPVQGGPFPLVSHIY